MKAVRHTAAKVLRHDHVAIGVTSLAQSKKWYEGVLGMQPFMADHKQFSDDDLAMVKAGDAVFALLRIPEGSSPLVGNRSNKGHAALRVTHKEVQRLYKELPTILEEHRAHPQQTTEIEAEDYGAQLSLFFHDPDGNELELCAWVDDDCKERF